MLHPASSTSPSSSSPLGRIIREAPLSTSLDPSLLAAASAAERVDNANWFDDFASAPPHVRQALGMRWEWNPLQPPQSSLVMVSSHIPFFHFNVASTLGVDSDAAPEALLDSIQSFFGPGKTHHITVAETFPDDKGAAVDGAAVAPVEHKIHEQLVRRGYFRYLSFDRVILQDPQPDLVASWSDWGSSSELVTSDNQSEWSSFLTGYYKMPELIGEWLQQLVGRPRWFHAILKRDGKVVMARSLYAHDDGSGSGWAWLGIDAPVPGWSPADCHDDDLVVCSRLLAAASEEAGVTCFASDVEAPNDAKSGPDYDKWRKLGFGVPYKRTVYKWEADAARVEVGVEADDAK